MEQTWRWFGPGDRITLRNIREAGAEGIVTALHEIPAGEVWPVARIQARLEAIKGAHLRWSVVESLDVSEDVKTRGPHWRTHVDAFRQTLSNLSQCGIRKVAYNLMPVFSWMRTHLRVAAPGGGFALRFDATAFAVFDLCMLKRPRAEEDWGEDRSRAAHAWFQTMSGTEREALQSTILRGLPGGNGSFSLEDVWRSLDIYAQIDNESYRANVREFLQAVCPTADEVGIQLCVHPDDPPRPLLGLPRIVSTQGDLEWLVEQWPTEANGITFCAGALGVRADNDLVRMIRRFGERIGFAHLRSTQRDELGPGSPDSTVESFTEAPHLEGDADLIQLVIELVKLERKWEGGVALPFRADHGQELLNDCEMGTPPGYPAVGRLRGLAELRGAMRMAERLLYES